MTAYYTLFLDTPEGPTPDTLLRREVEGDTMTDAYYLNGRWTPCPYSELDRLLSRGGGIPYDEITEAQAFELLCMMDAGDVHPFTT